MIDHRLAPLLFADGSLAQDIPVAVQIDTFRVGGFPDPFDELGHGQIRFFIRRVQFQKHIVRDRFACGDEQDRQHREREEDVFHHKGDPDPFIRCSLWT